MPDYERAAEVTNPTYRLIHKARAMAGPCPEDGRFPPAPQHPCPPPNDVWMAEASKLIDDMADELERMAYWVPEIVNPDMLRRFRRWDSNRRKSLAPPPV